MKHCEASKKAANIHKLGIAWHGLFTRFIGSVIAEMIKN